MGRALRLDVGQLGKPVRLDDGRVRVDAHITRSGVLRYRRDGKVIIEYRPKSEVFNADSLSSLALVPFVDEHPPDGQLLDSKALRGRAVGAVGESIRRDDDHVAGPIMVYDAATIAKMDSGKREVSAGYSCDLDETPGITPDGQRYDAIQRNIRYNHVALVDRGRAGSARVRMDAAMEEPMDGDDDLTTDRYDDDLSAEQRKNLGTHEFAVPGKRKLPIHDEGHVKAAMSRFGQTKGLSPEEKKAAFHKIVGAAKKHGVDSKGFEAAHGDSRADAATNPTRSIRMDKLEDALAALDAATKELAREKSRAEALADDNKKIRADADRAQGKLDVLADKVKELETLRADAAKVVPLEIEVERLRAAVDGERKSRLDAEDPNKIATLVRKRSAIEVAAREVLGETTRFDDVNDRDLMALVAGKLRGKRFEHTDSIDRVEAVFEQLVTDHRANAEAQRKVREAYNANRSDSATRAAAAAAIPGAHGGDTAASPHAYPAPLPNSREGRRAGKEH